jgi:ribonuclease P protein component
VLYAFPREQSDVQPSDGPADSSSVRFGVSVGRRVGGAVERNQVKRLLREAFWSVPELVSSSHDYVVVARQGAAQVAESGGLAAFQEDLRSLLERLDGVADGGGR